MIKELKGNLFRSDADVIVHGCNCFCTFGAGIAVQVKTFYPFAFAEDKKTKYGDRDKLGQYTSWSGDHFYIPNKKITVVNAYTQYYQRVELKPLDYNALDMVMLKIKTFFKDKTIAMPKIGAGLAGGDWNKIKEIINNNFKEKEVRIYVL